MTTSAPRFPRHSVRALISGSTALSIGLLTSSVALAAPPLSGSLPGSFSTNKNATAYTGGGTAATIDIDSSSAAPAVIQFGGTALGTSVSAPSNLSSPTNPGFSVGSGAKLTLVDHGSLAAPAVLINDETGNPSQIYGGVNASSLGGPLFVANANGVVVGAGGTINAPPSGLGLIGYAVDSNAFDGSTGSSPGVIAVNSNTEGTGNISVANNSVTGGNLLVAGNGAINVGSVSGSVETFAGYGFNTAPDGITATATSALSGSTSSVTFSGRTGNAATEVAALYAAGNVINTGTTDFTPAASAMAIDGTFTNSGIAYTHNLTAGTINNAGWLNDMGGTLTANGAPGAAAGADIVNTGVITEGTTSLTLQAGQPNAATGNVKNTGVIAFADPGSSLQANAQNIYFGGWVTQGGHALSATNPLASFALTAGYSSTFAGSGPVITASGVVDFASTIYGPFFLVGRAVQVLSGSLIDPIESDNPSGNYDYILAGSGTAIDPFFNNAKLSYNINLFPQTLVQAPGMGIEAVDTSSLAYGNINLSGVLSSQVPGAGFESGMVIQGNNVDVSGTGGIALNDGAFLWLFLAGNMDNPNGVSAAGPSDFRYDGAPVTVANAADGSAGTITLNLLPQGSTEQNVNILVHGNMVLSPFYAPPYNLMPGSPAISLASSPAPNDHLVVQATGNIDVGANYYEPGTGIVGGGSPYYWPGLVYLSTINNASNPTILSRSGAITLYGDLNNVLDQIVHGDAGVYFETNNFDLNGYTVSTNTNSSVYFANAKIAAAQRRGHPNSYYQAYLINTSSGPELGMQQLPAAYFQPNY